MTLSTWLHALLRVLSGRAALYDRLEPLELPSLDLPPLAPPVDGASHPRTSAAEHEQLERKIREHEEQLAKLRLIARTRGHLRDP